MTLSFQRSAGYNFDGIALIAPGQINIIQPNGIETWKQNVVFYGKNTSGHPFEFTIDSAMPPYRLPSRMEESAKVIKVSKPPVLMAKLDCKNGPANFIRWPGNRPVCPPVGRRY